MSGRHCSTRGSLSLSVIGLVLALAATAASLASALAHRLPIRSVRGTSWLLFGAGAILAVTALVPGWMAALAMVLYFALCAAGEVFLDASLQRAIRGRARATIASVSGLAQECFGILFYLLVGWAAGDHGWSAGLLALATVQVFFALSMAMRRERTPAG